MVLPSRVETERSRLLGTVIQAVSRKKLVLTRSERVARVNECQGTKQPSTMDGERSISKDRNLG